MQFAYSLKQTNVLSIFVLYSLLLVHHSKNRVLGRTRHHSAMSSKVDRLFCSATPRIMLFVLSKDSYGSFDRQSVAFPPTSPCRRSTFRHSCPANTYRSMPRHRGFSPLSAKSLVDDGRPTGREWAAGYSDQTNLQHTPPFPSRFYCTVPTAIARVVHETSEPIVSRT